MSIFEILDIGIVLAVCFYVSYTDVKYRKIGNLYTYSLVFFGLICQGYFVYLGATTIPQVLWLLLGGLSAAFLMYYLGVWSPGDSKLFWGVSMALPPTLYGLSWWRYPPFLISVNTFVPYFLITMTITTVLFLVLRFFVASLGDYLFVKEVNVSDLAKGMVPANIIIRDREGNYGLHDPAFTSFISVASRPQDSQVIMDITPEGLSEDKVTELKELAQQGHFTAFEDKVKVQDAIPFAPIVLVGVTLTIISRGIFLERLLQLINQ